jgi:TolA-binding protein
MPEVPRKKGNIRLTSQERAKEKELSFKPNITPKQLKILQGLKVKDLKRRLDFLNYAIINNRIPESKKKYALELYQQLTNRDFALRNQNESNSPDQRRTNLLFDEHEGIDNLKEFVKANINRKKEQEQENQQKVILNIGFTARTGLIYQDPFKRPINPDVAKNALNNLYHWSIDFYKSGDLKNSSLCLNELKDALITNPLFDHTYISSWLEVLDNLNEDLSWPRKQIGGR